MRASIQTPSVRRSLFLAAILAAVFGSVPDAQERKVPNDSARISIPGCAKGRIFIVGQAAEHEPTTTYVEPGRRFRLNGQKKLLEEIKKHGAQMLEVTGLVRQADLASPGGIALGGGRVRIGGGPPVDPMSDRSRNAGIQQAVLDLESWRALPDPCPTK